MNITVTNEVILMTQIVSLIGFVAAVFLPYRLLVKTKDGTIQQQDKRIDELKEKISELRLQSTDVLVKALGERISLLNSELERLRDDKARLHEDNSAKKEEIQLKEGELAHIWEQLKKLEGLRDRDELTGLPNRRAFKDFLWQKIEWSKRSGGKLAVVIFDVDHFKPVNDQFGHELGDKLLTAIAGRARDFMGDDAFMTRFGGDEFGMVMEYSDSAKLKETLEHFVVTMSKPYRIDGETITAPVSGGGSLCPTHGDEPEALVHKAYEAVFEGKRQRPSIVFG